MILYAWAVAYGIPVRGSLYIAGRPVMGQMLWRGLSGRLRDGTKGYESHRVCEPSSTLNSSSHSQSSGARSTESSVRACISNLALEDEDPLIGSGLLLEEPERRSAAC